MKRCDLIFLALKGVLAWLLLSGLLWYFGAALITSVFPLLEAIIMAILPELSSSLKLLPSAQSQPDDVLELSAWVLKPIYLNAGQFLVPDSQLKASANLLHILVPMVIESWILLLWPVRRWSQRLLLLSLGLISMLGVLLVTLPALLLGKLEVAFNHAAAAGVSPRPVPWFVDWMLFCEMGGGWLLAILAAGLCIWLQGKLLPDG